MTSKPTVIYIDSDGGSDGNPFRDAMAYFLREHCGCDVIVYDHGHHLKEDSLRLKKLINRRSILVFIITQERWCDEHTDLIKLIRKDFSKNIPIGIVKNWQAEKVFTPDPEDETLYLCERSEDAIDLIDKHRAMWEPSFGSFDYFDVRTSEEVEVLTNRLDRVYEANQDEELALGPIDRNHRVFSEALRLRLLPASELKGEFDDVVRRIEFKKFSMPQVSPAVYEHEVEKIRQMKEAEQTEFYHNLLYATNSRPAEGGGVYKTETGRGANNYGFAIDAVTLEFHMTNGFGNHSMAAFDLGMRLDYLRMFKTHRKLVPEHVPDEERWAEREILEGTVVKDLPGFQTPILILYTGQEREESVKKVTAFIRAREAVIPVTVDGKLIET